MVSASNRAAVIIFPPIFHGTNLGTSIIRFVVQIDYWWYTYPSEKYESQLGLLFPIYEKVKNVPNHQPDIYHHIPIVVGL